MSEARAAEYRKKAQECRLSAERSISEEDKAAWLTIADKWQLLAERMDKLQRGARPSK